MTAMPILRQLVAPVAAALGRPELATAMVRELREDLIETAYLDGLVRHFTLAELEAMVGFYISAEWRSAASKMERFQRDLGAAIKPEVDRAVRAVLGR